MLGKDKRFTLFKLLILLGWQLIWVWLIPKDARVGYEVQALKQTSFDLYRGEFIAIMGASGSGKSTLLNIIGAMDAPDEGTIKLNGVIQEHIFSEPNATHYRSENIGFIFQSYNLLKDLSVEENIALPLLLKNEEAHEIDEKVNARSMGRQSLTAELTRDNK